MADFGVLHEHESRTFRAPQKELEPAIEHVLDNIRVLTNAIENMQSVTQVMTQKNAAAEMHVEARGRPSRRPLCETRQGQLAKQAKPAPGLQHTPTRMTMRSAAAKRPVAEIASPGVSRGTSSQASATRNVQILHMPERKAASFFLPDEPQSPPEVGSWLPEPEEMPPESEMEDLPEEADAPEEAHHAVMGAKKLAGQTPDLQEEVPALTDKIAEPTTQLFSFQGSPVGGLPTGSGAVISQQAPKSPSLNDMFMRCQRLRDDFEAKCQAWDDPRPEDLPERNRCFKEADVPDDFEQPPKSPIESLKVNGEAQKPEQSSAEMLSDQPPMQAANQIVTTIPLARAEDNLREMQKEAAATKIQTKARARQARRLAKAKKYETKREALFTLKRHLFSVAISANQI